MMNRNKRQMPFGFGQQMMPGGMPQMGMQQQGMQSPLFSGNQQMGMQQPMFSDQMMTNYDMERIQTEINELRRINSDLLKRVSRLENYLGIRGEVASEFDKIL